MNRLIATTSIATIILAAGCSHKVDEVWVATRVVPIYASESDSEEAVRFTISSGDTCVPLQSVVMKVYMHTELDCKSGRGWTIDKRAFAIKSNR